MSFRLNDTLIFKYYKDTMILTLLQKTTKESIVSTRFSKSL